MIRLSLFGKYSDNKNGEIMMDKNELISCFQDTLNLSYSDVLRLSTFKAQASNRVYKENFISAKKPDITKGEIIVQENTSFSAAKNFSRYGKTAVLNFANPENPGGGVQNGAMVQEECLCRSSNLYPCLVGENVALEYYDYHSKLKNHFYSDRLIYTNDVTVFKTDDIIPQLMPQEEWFKVDVITCAAPYIARRKYTNKTALKQLFKSRIKNIFESAIENSVRVIILGAFGCGAFKNPPDVVAGAFNDVINENGYINCFEKIVFAIKRTNESPCPNLMAFEYVFNGISAEASILRFCMPLGNSKSYRKYEEWKRNNPYYQKQFSILGDSISTLDGYIPEGYRCFYSGENCNKSGVIEMRDTWWGKVIDFFGGELLVNNSWSGSRVTKLPDTESFFPSGCSDERTRRLHINDVEPEVIIIYLGINDFANGVKIFYDSFETVLFTGEFPETFADAYELMLLNIRNGYPKAEIWCCTLNTTCMTANLSFEFPYNYTGIHIEEYNRIIVNIALSQDCKIIDLYDYNMPYDSIDGTHPNQSGMNTLATMIIRSIGGKEVEEFIDCRNDLHDYEMYCQTGDYDFYRCKKCGKRKQVTAWGNEVAQTENQQDKYLGSIVDGRYYVFELIANNGIFSSYLVRNVRLNNILAMKVCDKTNRSYSLILRDIILREFHTLMHLKHPSIPRIIDIIEDDKNIFIIREYVDGTSLDSVVKKYGAQSAETVISWAKQLCSALNYLHSFNPPYIYRDMKPSNLILTSGGIIKIIDFEMMCSYDPLKEGDTQVLGTQMGYAAPEQFCGGRLDVRTDIFGIGMTMHNLVTGVDPDKPPYVYVPIREYNPNLPKGLEYIIDKCTQFNPEKRYSNCNDLIVDLDNYKHLPPRQGIIKHLFGKK